MNLFLLFLKGIPKQVWVFLAVLIFIGSCVEGILFYGTTRYNTGVSDQKMVQQQAIIEAQRLQHKAEQELQQANNRLTQVTQERDAARAQALQHVHQEIQNAPDVSSEVAALHTYLASVRTRADARHSAAVASYTASLGGGGGT